MACVRREVVDLEARSDADQDRQAKEQLDKVGAELRAGLLVARRLEPEGVPLRPAALVVLRFWVGLVCEP